jgi:hypothetical protein
MTELLFLPRRACDHWLAVTFNAISTIRWQGFKSTMLLNDSASRRRAVLAAALKATGRGVAVVADGSSRGTMK